MKTMALPGLLDLRDECATAPQHQIGIQSEKSSITAHYNGPALDFYPDPGRERAQLIWDATFHIEKVWGYRRDGSKIFGDGVMYHFGILSDGTVCQLRDLDAVLYHCANATGNARSIAVTFVCGDGQTPTAAAWAAFERLCVRLNDVFSMAGRSAVKGHTEWPKFVEINGRTVQVKNSMCPGPIIMGMLRDYRAGRDLVAPTPALMRYRVNVRDGANVRTGPARTFPRALDNTLVFPFGHQFDVDGLNTDEATGEARAWVHCADGVGFVHVSIVERI